MQNKSNNAGRRLVYHTAQESHLWYIFVMLQHQVNRLLGIDIGGTKIAGGVVCPQTGEIFFSERVPTEAHEGGASVLARAIALARRLLAQLPEPVTHIGVGAGGQIDATTGMVLSALESILPGWAGQDIKAGFEQALGIPTFVDNDVNALALGECRFGAGKDGTRVVFLALGTGVGGAVMYEGRLLRGAHGIDTELGQLHLTPGVTLESRCCGEALWERFLEQGGSPQTDRKSLAMLARESGQSPAGRAIHALGTDLGWGLVSLANLFDPEVFVLGGGLSSLGDLLVRPAQSVLKEHAMQRARDTPIVLASLGSEASIVGAASIGLFSDRDVDKCP
jgi:glucokinase